ncbi:hypothetical protein EYF80_045367 [Liparis tanakae]|uniref:Uncharacterized protein n=1 Tax=Liparis tanakae TaxID=230148 RepID=A0A4Z2FUI0_9TELE|nr:hypothetical protein EYF80_045367 [Liparis tanakae]
MVVVVDTVGECFERRLKGPSVAPADVTLNVFIRLLEETAEMGDPLPAGGAAHTPITNHSVGGLLLCCPTALVCEEHQFSFAPLSPVALLSFAVGRALPLAQGLPLSGQGGGRGLALHPTQHGGHLRQVVLQHRRVEGHAGHRDRAGAARVLAVAVGVVELLGLRLTGETGRDTGQLDRGPRTSR